MNTASRLDINWPHPRGNCVSVSHITVVTSGCHIVTTLGSVITEYGSSATATPWLRREPRTDLWTELVLRDAAACGVYTALYTRTVVTVHCTHCTGNTCDHRLHWAHHPWSFIVKILRTIQVTYAKRSVMTWQFQGYVSLNLLMEGKKSYLTFYCF